jgi:hypothetical protein
MIGLSAWSSSSMAADRVDVDAEVADDALGEPGLLRALEALQHRPLVFGGGAVDALELDDDPVVAGLAGDRLGVGTATVYSRDRRLGAVGLVVDGRVAQVSLKLMLPPSRSRRLGLGPRRRAAS